MSTFYTYLYIDPTRSHPRRPDGEPIYVGKGTKRRAWTHLKRSDRHPLTNRLKALAKKGVQPIITFIAKDVDEELAFLVEVEAIDLYGRRDIKTGTLLNLNGGGEGGECALIGPSTRKKLSKAGKEFHADPVKRQNYLDGRKKTFTETWAKNFGAASKKFWSDEETRQRIVDAQTAAQNRPDVKARNIAMITEVHNRPEVKASKSAKMKAYWAKRRQENGTKS